jgi:hypothetical protein
VTSGGDTAVVNYNIVKIIPFLESLIPSIEAKIICILKPNKNESEATKSPVILKYKITVYSFIEYLEQNKYGKSQAHFSVVLRLNADKTFRIKNEYFLQNESSVL